MSAIAGLAARFARCRRGAAAIEFAIVGLAAMMLAIGVVELGRVLYVRNELSFAGDVGARAVLLDGAISDSAVEDGIRAAFRYRPDDLGVAVLEETADGQAFRTIVLTYPFVPLISVLSDAITLSVTRRVPAG